MKPGIRVLGIDDSPFSRGDRDALVIGVVCRKNARDGRTGRGEGNLEIEGVLSARVLVDGNDGTERLATLISGSRFSPQIKAVFLNGIMLAGFNVVDIMELSKKTGIPVLALTRKKPRREEVERAVKKVLDHETKLSIIRSSTNPVRAGSFYLQFSGTDLKDALEIVRMFGNGPVRLAHIISSGVVRGESRGRS